MDVKFGDELQELVNALAKFPSEGRDTATKLLLEQLLKEFSQQHIQMTNIFRTRSKDERPTEK